MEGQSPEGSEGQEVDVDCGVCEPCVPTHGVRPSAREVEEHNATHLPFRSWCPYCVAGKAKENAHFTKADDRKSDVPVVSMDYTYMEEAKKEDNQEGEELEEGTDEYDLEVKKRGMPILVVYDREHKYITTTVVPKRGLTPMPLGV